MFSMYLIIYLSLLFKSIFTLRVTFLDMFVYINDVLGEFFLRIMNKEKLRSDYY